MVRIPATIQTRTSTNEVTKLRSSDKAPKVAYVLDPRFPGGTSSAVAAELTAVSTLADIEVHAIDTAMFSERLVAPQLSEALMRLNLPLCWDSGEIAADVVIFHNPSCVKFQNALGVKLIARHLIVVTHENFLRPEGIPAFDIDKCLSQIVSSSIVMERSLAPISVYNRSTVDAWMKQADGMNEWAVLKKDWFNICAFDMLKPTSEPKNRRGRLSRPGFEKFPSQDVMNTCFPMSAESNVILGADNLMHSEDLPAHWTLFSFGALSVEQFFSKIDFFVYYTARTWRESFGRVIAEAIAAGKIVITDHDTAQAFRGAAIGANAEDVDDLVQNYVLDPESYISDVIKAQKKLKSFSVDTFQKMFKNILKQASGSAQ